MGHPPRLHEAGSQGVSPSSTRLLPLGCLPNGLLNQKGVLGEGHPFLGGVTFPPAFLVPCPAVFLPACCGQQDRLRGKELVDKAHGRLGHLT